MRRLLIFLILLGVLGAGAFFGGRAYYRAPGPLPQPRAVVVPHGGVAAVGAGLAAQGVVAQPWAFRIAAILTRRDGPIHAAELAFPAQASLAEVLSILRRAKPVQHELTVPEGFTAAQIATLLAQNDLLTGPVVVPPEGSVLPQTYAFERGTSRSALVARMQAAMTRAIAGVWAARDPAVRLAGPRQLEILASIVERETGLPAERPMVAAVFANRLRQDMRLQSDPTVAYAASGGGVLSRPLSRADLAWDNPYNTYTRPGLPSGPICSPGLAALQAAARPAGSQVLYFVANGTGGHAFAETLPEHERNVARYRALAAP